MNTYHALISIYIFHHEQRTKVLKEASLLFFFFGTLARFEKEQIIFVFAKKKDLKEQKMFANKKSEQKRAPNKTKIDIWGSYCRLIRLE